MWQPPQSRGIPENVKAALTAYTDGESLLFQGDPTQASLQTAALNQKLVAAGIVKQADLDAAAKITPDGSTPASGKQNPNVSTDTGGVESRSDFPSILPLSRSYTLGMLTEWPFILLETSQHWIFRQMATRGNGPLKPGQLVANLKLLATNILDPVLAQFPGMRLTNSIRPWEQGGQHPRGQAADLQIPGQPNKHYEMAKWIQDNVPFDQLLIERNSSGTWVHVSYSNPPTKKVGDPYKVAAYNTSSGKWYLNGIYNI